MSDMQSLVEYFENLPLFDERYINLKCINNYSDPITRQGNFSIIFIAEDIATSEKVVIKMFDPAKSDQVYRHACFDRENEVLKELLNRKRCLQLKKAMKTTSVPMTIGTASFDISMKYFVTEWLPIDIQDFYNNQKKVSVEEKLNMFKEILLAIMALHRHEIAHRDLKPDNVRGCEESLKKVVIAIDLGTSVSPQMQNLGDDYPCQVGHRRYAPPEALCGLAGNRKLIFYTDLYALGCMFFELFSPDLFFIECEKRGFFHSVDLFRSILATERIDKTKKWHQLLESDGHVFELPLLHEYTKDIPSSIEDYVNRIYSGLVAYDYRKRITLDEVLKLIDITLRVLGNEKMQKKLIERKRLYRQRRLEKIVRYNQRLLNGVLHD